MKLRASGRWAWWASGVGLALSCASTVPHPSAPVATKPSAAPPVTGGKPLPSAKAPAGVRRVGSCELRAAELTASELSATDACRASFSCDDGLQVSVSCDGENDGTNTSLCECWLGERAVSLPKPIPGEAPFSCERALEPCLSATGKKPK